MERQEIQEIIQRQREYFETGETLPPSARKAALRKLYAGIEKKEKQLCAALKKDLGKIISSEYLKDSVFHAARAVRIIR